MILTLTRETLSPATLGRLSVDGVYHSDTLELPWLDNRYAVSCILPGTYSIAWRNSPKFGRPMLHVENVPGRSGILIHPANQVSELRGCIAVGKRLAPDSLMESRPAVEALQDLVRSALSRLEPVTLTVRNPEAAV